MRKLLLVIPAVLILALPPSAGAIVGGTSPTRDYPHMGELRLDGDFICGSSLVRVDWLLTAAHCLQGEEPTDYSVHVGSTSRSAGGEVVAVVEGHIHPGYDGDRNDVALMRLAKPVKYAPIRMAAPSDGALEAPGVPVTATGWGATAYLIGSYPDELREVTVPLRSVDECEVAALAVGGFDPESMLCAGETEGGRDTCQGDSGGPLMAPDASGLMVLVGATSFGLGCGFPGHYGVYARVSQMREWIDSKLPAAPQQPGATPTPGPGATPTPTPGPGGGSGGGGSSGAPQDRRVRLVLPSSLGSAKKARRSRRLSLPIRASGPVRTVRVTLKRGRKIAGRATVRRIVGQTTVRLKVRTAMLRPGRFTLHVSARDGQNRPVKASAKPRLRR